MRDRRRVTVAETDGSDEASLRGGLGDVVALGRPRPMGFSIQNGLPASAAASAISRCRKFGAQMETMSTSGWASTSR
jgi:hypothetical protein